MNFADYWNNIDASGVSLVRPRFPVSYGDLRKRAQQVLDERIFSYVAGGAGDGLTQARNAEASQAYGIMPRMLRDRTTRDLSVALFGNTMASPIYVAPVGVIDAGLSVHFVSRAINAGFDGIVVTVDCGTLGWRPGGVRVALPSGRSRSHRG